MTGGTYGCLYDVYIRASLRKVQTDCFAEPVHSVTMIIRVTVRVVDDEKNRRSSQSCARILHSLALALTAITSASI